MGHIFGDLLEPDNPRATNLDKLRVTYTVLFF
jgi:hypothetical protein